MTEQTKAALVVSAHSADFVWRAGGAIALYAKRGYKVLIVCLSYGERGESAKLWKKEGATLESVKAGRKAEAEKAAAILGGEAIFFDIGDYPLRITDEHLYKLVDIYRQNSIEFVLTHSLEDPYNFDHPLAAKFAQEARIIAQAWGHNPGEKVIGAPGVFLFEPHQTEQCNWKPQVILDITEVWETKRKAIEAMQGQEHLWDYYTRVALQRGVQGKRNSGKEMKYGEAYQRIFPLVTESFQ
ncbi:MAG: PIG-L deacetylase family protein [Gammaproteobacteria bacterium]